MKTRTMILAALALAVTTTALGEKPPWLARRRPDLKPNYIDNARVLPSDWPAEPPSPKVVDAKRFATALRALCGAIPKDRAQRYAEWMIADGAEFGEDPFLLAALVYRQGHCQPDADELGGVGLTLIGREMYADMIKKGVARYQVKRGDRWVEKERRMDRFPFGDARLRRAEENLYFTAAVLAVWRDQHASIDGAFKQVPHRHYVSHFIWGDRVRSQRDEDRLFVDRRRLLEYYDASAGRPTQEALGVHFGSPLDGAPRVISSGIGDERDGGDRSHRGIDLDSTPGEPVRAAADGDVVFAGVDLPGSQNYVAVRRGEYDRYPRSGLGHGGRFVCIRHRRASGPGLRTCYMHLETVEVDAGMTVKRGDLVGTVGRTGMKESAAHLHFELHDDSGPMDASKVLTRLILGDLTRPPVYPEPAEPPVNVAQKSALSGQSSPAK